MESMKVLLILALFDGAFSFDAFPKYLRTTFRPEGNDGSTRLGIERTAACTGFIPACVAKAQHALLPPNLSFRTRSD